MAHIHIVRSHALGLEAVRTAADFVAEDLRQKHSLEANWEGDRLLVRGRGVKGELVVSPNVVDVKVRLGLSMRLFRRVLEREINETLDEHVTTGP